MRDEGKPHFRKLEERVLRELLNRKERLKNELMSESTSLRLSPPPPPHTHTPDKMKLKSRTRCCEKSLEELAEDIEHLTQLAYSETDTTI